jgi:non-ribosomal peptide synthetase component F
MTSSTSTDAFRAARDLLLAHREDYDAARREFAWPDLDEFNWALDWFDALRILSDDGSDGSLSYASLAARSSQVAGWLRGLGVRRGDRVLLMLGNVAPLWEVILATMKLGAVIIPASTLLQPADLVDRVARGQVRHVITDTAVTSLAGLPTRTRSLQRPRISCPRASPGPRIRCCCTSPRAPRRCPSWSRTLRSATRWGTCPPCTGSASSPATCT